MVGADRREQGAIGAEGDAEDAVGRAAEGQDLASAGDVPKSDRLVEASGGQAATAAVEGEGLLRGPLPGGDGS